MPSMSTYSHYETLAFFQSVARYGFSASSLLDISAALKQNEHVRNDADLDVNRFSVDSLRRLYQENLYPSDKTPDSKVNGVLESGPRSPKRRKLSSPVESQDDFHTVDDKILQETIDRLYIEYKNDAISNIQKEEEELLKIEREIKNLEQQVEIVNKQQRIQTPAPFIPVSENEKVNDSKKSALSVGLSQSAPQPAAVVSDQKKSDTISDLLSDGPISSSTSPQKHERPFDNTSKHETPARPLSTTQQSRNPSNVASTPNQHPSSNFFHKPIPTSSPRQTSFVPAQIPVTYPPGPSPAPQQISQSATLQQSSSSRSQRTGNQGRSPSLPYQNQHPYSPYPPYPPPPPAALPPQWHPHIPSQHFQQHSVYGPSPQYYPPPTNGRHTQTPPQMPYLPYTHTAPLQYVQQQLPPQQQHQQHQQQQQQPQQQWRGQQWPMPSISAVSTPSLRPISQPSISGSGSSTPWKRRHQGNQIRSQSPRVHPEREVSPLTDDEDCMSPARKVLNSIVNTTKSGEEERLLQQQVRRPGRPPSITPSATGASRSHSNASRTSDTREKRSFSRRRQMIKDEPPTTPLHVPSSDTEPRSSSRRGRPRSNTVASQSEGVRAANGKRKRDSASPPSRIQSSRPSVAPTPMQRIHQSYDSALVVVSKNFAKTSQLLLNGITSHKLAGIFAKPLSERDAPGYKDLVLRPQDLKSIKAAVSKGGRAALAAIEAIEGENESTPTKTQSATSSWSGVGPVGNGFYLVPRTIDLVPPKGIVNSAQLEMELTRMFANAIMFNPLTRSERGFGKSLGLRKNGGDVRFDTEVEDTYASETSDNASSSEFDEGGIIADAREMFHDVIEAVAKWRELEGERMMGVDASTALSGGLALPIPSSTADHGRRDSVSMSSNIGDDDTAAVGSEAANTPLTNNVIGPSRKRRRMAEH